MKITLFHIPDSVWEHDVIFNYKAPKDKASYVPSVLWIEKIIPLIGIKDLLSLVQVSHVFYALINNNKNNEKFFNLFTTTFYYLKEFFRQPPTESKKPLMELGYQLKNALELYDKTDSDSSIYARKFTTLLETGSITAALRILGDINNPISKPKKFYHSNLLQITFAENLLSVRSHGGKTVVEELKKSLQPKSISILEGLKIYSYDNIILDQIFTTFIYNFYSNYCSADNNLFEFDPQKQADLVLEKITFQPANFRLCSEHKQVAIFQLYIVSYACNSSFFERIHPHIHSSSPTIRDYIIPFCIKYNQIELVEFFIKKIPLPKGHTNNLIADSVQYAASSAIYLIIENFEKKSTDPSPISSFFELFLKGKNPVFLYNLLRLNPEKFLQLAQDIQLQQKAIMIELLWRLGPFPVKWLLANWRNKVLKDGGNEVKSSGKVFLELTYHFASKNNFAATNFDNVRRDYEDLSILILKHSPFPSEHAQEILITLSCRHVPRLLSEASALITQQQPPISSLLSESLLNLRNRKRTLGNDPVQQDQRIAGVTH